MNIVVWRNTRYPFTSLMPAVIIYVEEMMTRLLSALLLALYDEKTGYKHAMCLTDTNNLLK